MSVPVAPLKHNMNKRITGRQVWKVIKTTIKNFGSYHLPRHSAALSYYTLFSFAPLLVVLLSVAGLFLSQDMVQEKVNAALADFLGTATAAELQQLVKKAALQDKNIWGVIIGGATLLLAATSVFGQIQESLNAIWGVKARAKRGWLRLIKKRLLSFSIIITLGFLMLVSLAISALIDLFAESLINRFPGLTPVLIFVINLVITFLVVSLIFAVIFRFLPDTDTPWRDVWAGALVTGALFLLGKFAISIYLSRANLGATYGAAGAIVVLLVWVYYSSMILYFGAALTRNWIDQIGGGIQPDEDAATVRVVEIETGNRYKHR